MTPSLLSTPAVVGQLVGVAGVVDCSSDDVSPDFAKLWSRCDYISKPPRHVSQSISLFHSQLNRCQPDRPCNIR